MTKTEILTQIKGYRQVAEFILLLELPAPYILAIIDKRIAELAELLPSEDN